jgi:inosine-uridine nucleoside N-ribohydrolase
MLFSSFTFALLMSMLPMPLLAGASTYRACSAKNNPGALRSEIPNPLGQTGRDGDNDRQRKMVIVDSDMAPWGDDSMALCLLLQSPAVRILGVTSTSGNVWSEQANVNLLRLLEVIEHPEIAVYPGIPSRAHADRLAYYNTIEKHRWAKGSYAGALAQGTLPPVIAEPPGGQPKSSLDSLSAVDFIIEQARKFPGQVTLLLLGPTTNLAAALRKDPGLGKELDQVFIFGGAIHVPGNTTKMAEFNFWFDPESANEVLTAGLPLTLVPLDATEGKQFDPKMATFFAKYHSPTKNYLNQYFENRLKRRGGRPIPIWDEVLAGIFLDPSIVFSPRQDPIRVVLKRGSTYGASRSSLRRIDKEKPVKVIYQVDTKALHNLIYRLFREGISDEERSEQSP